MNRSQRRAAGMTSKAEREAQREERRRLMLSTVTIVCSGVDGPCQERTSLPFVAMRSPQEFNASLEHLGWTLGMSEGYTEETDHLSPLCTACSELAFSPYQETEPSTDELLASVVPESQELASEQE